MRVRPIGPADNSAWRRVRQANQVWLGRWDATPPSQKLGAPRSFGAMVRHLRREARAGRQLPFVVEYDGKFVGQLTVSNIVRGSAQFGSIGYWIDEAYAGRGIMPRAVALAVDHCFGPVGLIGSRSRSGPRTSRPCGGGEAGFGEIGLAPRYLHIDGDWRDHRLFAITREEVPLGMVDRLDRSLTTDWHICTTSHKSHLTTHRHPCRARPGCARIVAS